MDVFVDGKRQYSPEDEYYCRNQLAISSREVRYGGTPTIQDMVLEVKKINSFSLRPFPNDTLQLGLYHQKLYQSLQLMQKNGFCCNRHKNVLHRIF